jgi:hypothetical protein
MTRSRDTANIVDLPNAKGDIYASTAADTPAVLSVGNNGETLVADSSTSTGLRYTAGTVQPNPVLNSAMQNWQRGTSISIAAPQFSTYTADRWPVTPTANAATTVSRQATGDITNLAFIQYCQRVQRNSGQTGTTGQFIYQSFESINSIPFAGKTVTASFYVRAGATFLSSGAAITAKLWSGTGTDQNLLSGFTGQVSVVAATPTLTATWQRVTFTGTVGTTATQLALGFDMGAVGTAGATDYVETTGWQIDIGSVALPFRTYAGTIQGELAACQRYYQRFTTSQSPFSSPAIANGIGASSTRIDGFINLMVPMRIPPSALDYSGMRWTDQTNNIAASTIALAAYSQFSAALACASVTGVTQYRPYQLNFASSSDYLGFTAEL